MRGGRPPASSRAIADCVVPVSSARLRLGQVLALALRSNFLGDLAEEPALVGIDVREPLAQSLEGIRLHISPLL